MYYLPYQAHELGVVQLLLPPPAALNLHHLHFTSSTFPSPASLPATTEPAEPAPTTMKSKEDGGEEVRWER